MAFSDKIRLVSADWITSCVVEQRIVDDSDFLVKGIVLGNKHFNFKNSDDNDKILRNTKFCVESKDNDAISYRKVIRLIENCGGVVTDSNDASTYVSMTEKTCGGLRMKTVTYRYILDSLTFQKQLKIEGYLLI